MRAHQASTWRSSRSCPYSSSLPLFHDCGHCPPLSPTSRCCIPKCCTNLPAFLGFPCATINAFSLDQAPEAGCGEDGEKLSTWAKVGALWLFSGRLEQKGKERSSGFFVLGEKPNSVLVLLSVPKTSLIRWNHVQLFFWLT